MPQIDQMWLGIMLAMISYFYFSLRQANEARASYEWAVKLSDEKRSLHTPIVLTG